MSDDECSGCRQLERQLNRTEDGLSTVIEELIKLRSRLATVESKALSVVNAWDAPDMDLSTFNDDAIEPLRHVLVDDEVR